MDKSILVQYCDMKEEVKDLRRRIDLENKKIKQLENEQVADAVKGTRKDGTIGSIQIQGFPSAEYERKKSLQYNRRLKLELAEAKLLELITEVEEYIDEITESELRIMFRLYYVDDLTWIQVAHSMNSMFPKRRIKYTDDSCRMKHNRFLDKIEEIS